MLLSVTGFPARRRRHRALPVLAVAALIAAWSLPAGALAADTVSTNWAGYVATPSDGHAFTSVSGSWTVPSASCTTKHAAYSAVWVGLGGYRGSSKRLEQVGSESDCNARGRAIYSAWWEIVPAAPVAVRIAIRPGDELTASATVSTHGVTLRLRDLTSGARFSTTRHISRTDASSAEWIVEAPSACRSNGTCTPLALADFGTAAFSGATATAGSRTDPAAGASWALTSIQLEQETVSLGSAASGRQRTASRSVVSAVPSAIAPSSGAFTVTRSARSSEITGPEPPTLPGFGGEGA